MLTSYREAQQEARLPTETSYNPYISGQQSFRRFLKDDISPDYIFHDRADFSNGNGTLKDVQLIRKNLLRRLRKYFPYGSRFTEIGSYYDGTKIGKLNEADCHFLMDVDNLEVREGSSRGRFKVSKNGKELTVEEMHTRFVQAASQAVSEIELPQGWKHDGYGGSGFSAVRCTGPAVTAMFRTRDDLPITLDISLAIPLTTDIQESQDFPDELIEKCEKLSDTVAYIQSKVPQIALSHDLVPYLIADPVGDAWTPTAAWAEAEILRTLPYDCSVKEAVQDCKAIASRHQKWLSEILASKEMPRKKTKEGEMLNKLLDRYSSTENPEEKSQIKTFLNTCMPYLHIFLTSRERKQYNEMSKSPIAINTAAIKHIILKKAMTMKDAFSVNNESSKEKLVRAVFKELADTNSFYTQHAIFDDMEISKFSTSVPVTDIKKDLAFEVQMQCQRILVHIVSKARKLIA